MIDPAAFSRLEAAPRRAFVESSVRLCASLRLQLETVQRCLVCLHLGAKSQRGCVLLLSSQV